MKLNQIALQWALGICLSLSSVLVLAQNEEADANTAAQTDEGASPEGLRMNFRNVPLEMVLDYMSEAAGFSIISEVDVSGTVSVWNNNPLSEAEAISLLDSILIEKGYTAVRVGNTLKIVSKSEARQENIPVRSGADPQEIPQSDRMVTQIIPVRYTGAMDLIENLQPLLPDEASMTANESSNAIVLTGTENSIRRVAEIVRALDTSISGISQIKVYPLRYSDATELAKIVKDLFESPQTSSRSSSRSSSRGGFPGGFPGRFGSDRGGDSGRGSSRGGDGDSEALQAATR